MMGSMPICKFGRDNLLEKGYIVLDEGKVVVNHFRNTVALIRNLKT